VVRAVSRKQRFKDFLLGVGAALEMTLILDLFQSLGLTVEQKMVASLLGLAALYYVYKRA